MKYLRKAYQVLTGEEDLPLEDYERVLLVRAIENFTGFEFKNTKDFKEKIEQFLLLGENPGETLKRVRKNCHLSQRSLGKKLSLTQAAISMMESGEIPLNGKVIKFIKKKGKKDNPKNAILDGHREEFSILEEED